MGKNPLSNLKALIVNEQLSILLEIMPRSQRWRSSKTGSTIECPISVELANQE
jgi:hypothetical protein